MILTFVCVRCGGKPIAHAWVEIPGITNKDNYPGLCPECFEEIGKGAALAKPEEEKVYLA